MRKFDHFNHLRRNFISMLLLGCITFHLVAWAPMPEASSKIDFYHILPIVILGLISVVVAIAGGRYNRRDFEDDLF